ncbi:hypothetical protein HDV02_004237 [Globomyces sp. JEL0801]|nr:hypothetical protein HDV02_004237 [Globomyces sp. JEL0801]
MSSIRNVKFFSLDDRAGKFAVSFPTSYPDLLNFCEGVHFLPPDWVPYNEDSSKQPVFSHDELLVVTAQSDIDDELAT